MHPTKIVPIFCLLLFVTSCGVGEFFIKRYVLKMEVNVAKELKSYADFTVEQEAEIDQIANSMTRWIRGVRLPLLKSELELIAAEIEQSSRLSDVRWRSFVTFGEEPFTLSKAPGLMNRISAVIHGMNESQIRQALRKLDEDHGEKIRELEQTTSEDQLDEIMDGIKIIFKDIGIKRSREQIREATKLLAKREHYIDLEKHKEEENHRRFTELLNNRSISLAEFQQRFLSAWLAAEESPKKSAQERWEKNFIASHEMINYLLADLSKEKRVVAATSIRKYALLFDELSRFE